MKKLKVGDKLFRYSLHILEYEVYGVIKRDVGTMYEIICKSCIDHEPCQILIADGGKHGYKFINMLNNDGYNDYGFNTEQSYWHSEDKDEHQYYLTKNEAVLAKLNNTLNYYKDSMKKIQKNMDSTTKKIDEIEAEIETINDLLKGNL